MGMRNLFVSAAVAASMPLMAWNGSVLVSTPNTSMLLHADEGSDLRFAYYGERIDESEIHQIHDAWDGLNQAAYPAFGEKVHELTALQVVHSDGNMTLELTVQDVQTHDDGEAVETVVTLADGVYPFTVDLHYRAYKDVDVIESWATYKHNEKKDVVLKRFDSFQMPIRQGDVWISHLYGSWAAEASVSTEPLLPGKSGSIRVTFTPARLPETFSYKIMVYSNARENRLELKVEGNLVDNPEKPALLYNYTVGGSKFKRSNLHFGKVYPWLTVTDTVYYLNTRQETVTLSTPPMPAHLQAKFMPATVKPGERGMLVLTYDANAKGDYGYCYESVLLLIDGKRDLRNRLTLTATIAEDFSRLSEADLAEAPAASFKTKEESFGDIRKGTKADCHFTLTNTGKRPLFIRATKTSCGCAAVTLGKKVVAPGESATIRVTFDSAGKSGRQYKTVTVITNDPRQPETELRIKGNVTP